MPYSKNIYNYPAPLRELLTTIANSETALSLDLPAMNSKEAIRNRALFYALRKLMMERLEEQGNIPAVERLSTVSVKLADLPNNQAQLTITNEYGGFSKNFIDTLENFLETHRKEQESDPSHTAVLGGLTEAQRKELEESLTQTQTQIQESEEEIRQRLARYQPTARNPYLSDDDDAPQEDSEAARARAEWKEHEDSLDVSDVESKHSCYATPEERKAQRNKDKQK